MPDRDEQIQQLAREIRTLRWLVIATMVVVALIVVYLYLGTLNILAIFIIPGVFLGTHALLEWLWPTKARLGGRREGDL